MNETKKTDGTRLQVCKEAHSYATRENALLKLKKTLGEDFETVRYIIVAQTDGRFSPAVILSDNVNVTYLIHNNVCVIG